jgi:very-short-patch-repair endonuclease
VLNDLLRTHDGVLTKAQAKRAGLSQDAINRRIRSRHWKRCAPGVYFVNDRPFTDAARIRAAVLSYGEHAAASGLAAAWWLGLTKFAPDVVEVTVPRNSHGRCHEGSRVRRRNLKPGDVIEHNGLRVTSLALTVVEAAVRRGGGPQLMDQALQRHTELPKLWAAHLRNKGRWGSPRARMLLQAAEEGTRSAAERLFAKLLRQAGITGWKANQKLLGYEVDFLFEDALLVVEVDGWAHHADPETFRRDRVKQNALIRGRYRVLRYTWIDLAEYSDRVVAEIRAR